MPDYGHDLEFGCFITPSAERADQVLALAKVADTVGLDLVSVQDHPYQPAHLDAWTLLAAIAASTLRVRVFPNVVNLPLRPPAVLAQATASLDILSGGRAELGLGAGAFWDAVAAMGGPRRTPGEAVDALAEAITVIRALWTPGRGPRFAGKHYQLDGAKPGPFPVHPVEIWVGALKPRMLRLIGRSADGWVPSSFYAGPEELAGMNQIIDEAAVAAGRQPADVRRLYNVSGSFSGSGADFLQGPPGVWVEQLAELALTEGVSTFILASDRAGDLRRFAEEVAPGVRELVAAERVSAVGRAAPAASTATGSPGTVKIVSEPVDRLGVVPTPDDGRRLTTERLWDEQARPRGPEPDPDATYLPAGRADGQRLVDIHNHLRNELTQLRELVSQVESGHLDVGAARSMINTMTLRQNNWTLGTYCESYCRVVNLHHTIEDDALFPRLRRADPRLAPVVDRLTAEHHVIADVLERVDAALVALVAADGKIEGVRAAVDVLADVLLSHLSYEERELVEPLARLSLGV